MRFRKAAVVIFLMVYAFSFTPYVNAVSEEEKSFLAMYFTEEELHVVSATRSLKSITRVAENVEVVTKEEIELMNAHTVVDVLMTVNGIQINPSGGPGTLFAPRIQGSEFYHIAAFVDGIPQNNYSDNFPDISFIPAGIIEKIEIIKGPASSAWGSSLGGVINIITKSAGGESPVSGILQASYGEQDTGDFRAEARGGKGGFGYYLYAGRLQSDGLTPNFDVSINNLYSRLAYRFTDDTDLDFKVFYSKSKRGDGDDPALLTDLYFHNRFENMFSGLTLNSKITKELRLSMALRGILRREVHFLDLISTGEELFRDGQKDKSYGASLNLNLRLKGHDIVLGSDYEKGDITGDTITNGRQTIRKTAIFINDTMTIGNLSIIPGLRYDDISTTNDFLSPSMGLTYNIAENTVLRAFVARGFTSPSLASTSAESTISGYKANPDLKVERIVSYQLGVETAALKFVWLKFSAFRHRISDVIKQIDIIDPDFTWTSVNGGKQRRQGFEFELRTRPVYHFTLTGGTTFIETKDLETDMIIKDIPKYTFDVGLKYDDEKSFRALLTGHYIWWNAESFGKGNYSSVIFDLNVIKSIYKTKERDMEVFLTAHNLFDGSQYLRDFFKNPGRWIEAGLRYKF